MLIAKVTVGGRYVWMNVRQFIRCSRKVGLCTVNWVLYESCCFCEYNTHFLAYSGCRSQWPHGLRRRSAAARLLRFWFRIPPGAWTFVCCECCLCCQVEVCATSWSLVQMSPTDCGASLCDIETSWMRRPWPTEGCRAKNKQTFRVIMNILIASLADQRLCNVAFNVIQSGGKVPVRLLEVECKLVWKSLWMSCAYGFSKCWKWSVWMGLNCFQHSAALFLQRCTGTLHSLCVRIWCITVWALWKQAWVWGFMFWQCCWWKFPSAMWRLIDW